MGPRSFGLKYEDRILLGAGVTDRSSVLLLSASNTANTSVTVNNLYVPFKSLLKKEDIRYWESPLTKDYQLFR